MKMKPSIHRKPIAQKRPGNAPLALLFILLLSLSALITGCGEGGQKNDSLTIFAPTPQIAEELQVVVNRYQSKFPDVEVTIMELPDGCPKFNLIPTGNVDRQILDFHEQYEAYLAQLEPVYQSLRDDLRVGVGPDLVLFDEAVFPDVNKTILSGTFLELNKLIEDDPEFDLADFSEPVLKAGQVQGEQRVFPLYYDIGVLLSSEESLEAFGLNRGKFSDFNSLLAEAARCAAPASEQGARLFYDAVFPADWYSYAGLGGVDYGSRKAELDSPEFRAFQESYRALYEAGQLGQPEPYEKTFGGAWKTAYPPAFADGEAVLLPQQHFFDAISLCLNLSSHELTPVLSPIRKADGGIQAQVLLSAGIPSASRNQKNAFEFLKLLACGEYQSLPYSRPTVTELFPRTLLEHLPVNNRYLQARLDNLTDIQGDADLVNETYGKWVTEIGSAVYPSDLDDRINEWFAPFHRGESSYEDCLKKAQEQLTIYITE